MARCITREHPRRRVPLRRGRYRRQRADSGITRRGSEGRRGRSSTPFTPTARQRWRP